MRLFPRFLSLFLFLLVIGACAHAEVGRKFDTAAASRIEIGKTTEPEVLTWLGQPLNQSNLPNGKKIYVYQYIKSQAHAGLLGIQGHGEGNMLSIAFDQQGIVRGLNRSNTPVSLGPGTGK